MKSKRQNKKGKGRNLSGSASWASWLKYLVGIFYRLIATIDSFFFLFKLVPDSGSVFAKKKNHSNNKPHKNTAFEFSTIKRKKKILIYVPDWRNFIYEIRDINKNKNSSSFIRWLGRPENVYDQQKGQLFTYLSSDTTTPSAPFLVF